jgi:tRNA(Leu) C34 or U34 (ribose-2'-O)-methylase TrmL
MGVVRTSTGKEYANTDEKRKKDFVFGQEKNGLVERIGQGKQS